MSKGPFIPCDEIAKLNATIKSLVCSINELSGAVNGGGSGNPGTGSALNEIIEISAQSSYVVAWNSTRITKYGQAPVINVYVKDQDGKWLWNPVQFEVDNAANPTTLTFNFGFPIDAVIVIS